MKKRSMHLFLEDISQSVEMIDKYTNNMPKESFFKDALIRDAVVRRLEIMGEAAKNVPQELKEKHPEIPWDKMTELGDMLEHDCFSVNMERVWATVKEDIPDLKEKVKTILDKTQES